MERLKRALILFLCFLMVFSPYTNTAYALEDGMDKENELPVVITEVYPNDKSNRHIDGAGENDLYEFIEIYNNTNEEINFNDTYKVRYDYISNVKDLNVAPIVDGEEVVIPANTPAVLWIERTSSKITGAAKELTVDDFRAYHNIPDDVPVYMLQGQDGLNNVDRGFLITDKDNNEKIINHVHYSSEDVGDGLSLQTKVPRQGPTLDTFEQKATPTPGTVQSEQLIPAENSAPTWKHESVDSTEKGNDFTIATAVEDPDQDPLTVTLFYQTTEMDAYKDVEMTAAEGEFTYTIPASEMNGNEISYFFVVSDGEVVIESDRFEVAITEKEEESQAPTQPTEPEESEEPSESDEPSESVREEDTNGEPSEYPIFFTEVYPNDTDNSHIDGAGSADLFEFVEVYNNSDEVLEFNQVYKVRYDWREGSKDLAVTNADEPTDTTVEIPANSPAVLWVTRSSLSGDAANLTEADFRAYHGIPDNVAVFAVRNQDGLPNASDRSFYITKKEDNSQIISEIRFTAGDSSDGMSFHTRVPQEGYTVNAYQRKGTPTPGIVEPEQLVPSTNAKLVITLPELEEIDDNHDLTIQANVTDEDADPLTVKLFYRTNPYGTFTEVEMESRNHGNYEYTIAKEDLGNYVFHYYVEASDGEAIVESEIMEVTVKSAESDEIPRILITEMTPNPAGDYRRGSGNQYEVMEIYNNSDEVLNLNGYTIFYLYPNNSSAPKKWTIEEDTAIEPYSTAVVWFAKEAVSAGYTTVEDLNIHYNSTLAEDDVIFYDNGDSSDFNLPNSLHRGLAISSSDSLDDMIVEAWYDATVGGADRMINDVRNSSVRYTYPESGKEMVRIDTRAYSNPGNIDDGQVPEVEGKDVVAPMIEHEQPIYRMEQNKDYTLAMKSQEELEKATLLYGTAEEQITDFTNEIEMELIDATDGEYIYAADLRIEEVGSYRYMITTEDASGNQTNVPYNSRGNPITVVEEGAELELPEPGLSFEQGERLNGKVSFYAYGEDSADDLTVRFNGEVITGTKALPGPVELNFQGGGIDYIYQASASAINPDGDREYFTRILPSYVDGAWYTYEMSQRYFIADEKVSIHSGSENVPYDLDTHDEHFNKTNFDDFEVINLHLVLPDGSVIKPEKVLSYLGNLDQIEQPYRENVYYVLGDGSAPNNTNMTKPMKSDFIFDIPEEKLTATYFELDTTNLADGTYEVTLERNNEQVETVEITVDNTNPVIHGFVDEQGNTLADGETYKGDLHFSVDAEDNLSGVENMEAFLNGEEVGYPFLSSSAILEAGTHELAVNVYDGAGNMASANMTFVIESETPDEPSELSPNDFGEDVGDTATLQAKVTDPSGDKMDVTFFQGKKYDFAGNENIEGFTNVADREPPLTVAADGEKALSDADKQKIALEDGEYLVHDTTMGFPYHRFEVTVDETLSEGDKVELYWKGKTLPNRIVTLYAWDYEANEWVARDTATGDDAESDITLSSLVEKDRFIRDGKIQAMVQDEVDSPNDPFTMLWMTDTQYYAESYPYIWDGLGDWVVDEYHQDRFQYVIHSGDIVNVANSDEQWEVADRNLQKLDDANVPYGLLAGNHDAIIDGVDYSYFHQYVGADRYEDNPWYGGSMDNNRNHYDLMSFGGHDFVIVYLGFGTEDTPETIAWANEVLEKHADRNAILVLHAYLEYHATLSNMAQNVFDQIIVPNENVKMVMGGHYHGVTKRISEIPNEDGSTRQVLEMLADYQGGPNGGDGYVRFIEFDPVAGTVFIDTYSPILDDYHFFEPEMDSFTVDFEFVDINKRVATDYFSVNVYQDNVIGVDEGVASGEMASTEWSGLQPNETYYWYMNITDEYGATRRSDVFRFATGDFEVEEEERPEEDGDVEEEREEYDPTGNDNNTPGDEDTNDEQGGINENEVPVDREENSDSNVDEAGQEKDEDKRKEVDSDEEQQEDDTNKGQEKDDESRQGNTLPGTATNIFNWLLAGMILVSLGIVGFYLRRKRA